MKSVSFSYDKGKYDFFWRIFLLLSVLLPIVLLADILLAEQSSLRKPSKADIVQKTQKLQIPFITNNGQMDERVKFYTKTFGGTVFVTNSGEFVYSLPKKSKGIKSGVVLKEEIEGGKISMVTGEEKTITNVSCFRGNNQSNWRNNIPTYEVINLGEVYQGIALRLRAYGNNVEKLFCVKPDANPEIIKTFSLLNNPMGIFSTSASWITIWWLMEGTT